MKSFVTLTVIVCLSLLLSAAFFDDTRYVSFSLEFSMVILLTVVVVNLYKLRRLSDQYTLIFRGFILFLVSALFDSSDELIQYPELVSQIFEDLLSLFALGLVFIGVRKWLAVEREKAEQLFKMATTDALTGAYNRRYFLDKVADKKQGALLILDLDHFKKINDNFGHQAGDDSLKAFVNCLKRNLNGDALLARWGGEEFILYLNEHCEPTHTAETVLHATRAIRVPHEQGELQFTVSIGGATLTSEGFKKALAEADERLYKAKSKGRDQAALFG